MEIFHLYEIVKPKSYIMMSEEYSNPLMKEYESLIKTLRDEVEYYKIELDDLRNESITLVRENKTLSSYIKQILHSNENSPTKQTFQENDLVENLKTQIQLLMKEKESTTELWRNSLNTIDYLEDELRLYEGRTHGYVSKSDVKKVKEEYQRKVKELEMELMQTKVSLLESQKSAKSIIDLKTNELRQLNETHQETSKVVQNLQNNIQQLQEERQKLQQEKSHLENTLKEKKKAIGILRSKEMESQMKVAEAIQIVDAALLEKDAALLREQQAKDEILQLTKTLTETIDAANKKLQLEIESAKKQYTEKAQKLKQDMRNLSDSLKEKGLELEKERNSAKVLEEKLGIIQKGNLDIESSNTSKLLMLEKNLETTFQKLLFSEKKNIQLEAENKSIKDDLEQMANLYNRDIKTRESEKIVLESKIGSLQNELDISNSNLVQVASKMEEVNAKVVLIETELQKQMHLKDVKNEKILSNKIKEIEMSNSKLNTNVKKRLEAQIRFNKKWKVTMNEIVEKLEKRVQDLKQETHALRQSKKELRQKLKEAEEELNSYRERLKSLCLDVTKVARFSKEHLFEKETHVKFAGDYVEATAV